MCVPDALRSKQAGTHILIINAVIFGLTNKNERKIAMKKNISQEQEKVVFKKYSQRGFFVKFILFFYYKMVDVYKVIKYGKEFDEYGMTMYCGRQGAGKTTAMVEYLERMREKYPDALILTNFGYKFETRPFKDWRDFFDVKNGTKGVIFAIDEIQNEFSSSAWRNFPESLLSEVTQQRKQRVKIVCTSQIFTRVAKPLREQCMDVVDCFTIAGRWTWIKCFDAVDYNKAIDTPNGKDKLRRLYIKTFIQDDYLRSLYDSYAKIERISNTEYLSRIERGA